MPTQVTTAFLAQAIGQGDPRMIAVGRYFLLDPVAEMRDAAIAGFGLLAKNAHVDAALPSDLILIRNWLSNGKALDTLIKISLRREPFRWNCPATLAASSGDDVASRRHRLAKHHRRL
ncbi:hypothetical protein [Leisingera daeponensis]|uniref:hypothetical protein n=1 Tax=Leisingera daeponensis TaxID=405746 RepID=UPI001C970358|nr:hypothetical protein [Leisingera daeponensis]MBY6059674.1 hypothetical protein [Leisingera daeponensis]